MKIYRYPGVRPFEATEKALFFGRDRDIADLYEMVRAERLVVLFGKSGYGKSSLLNAGVLPKLQTVMTPVEVRLGEYIPNQSLSPVETLRRKAPMPTKLEQGAAFLAELPPTLWVHFKQLDSVEKGAYLLVFDQFEEFFSYSPEQQRDFRDQLADLLNGELPEGLRETARTLDRDQRRLLAAPMDIRVLFAIRSDRLHELDRLKDRLPAILHKRYELKALSREQAREAIVQPALLVHPILEDQSNVINKRLDNPSFFSPPFEYREDALTIILKGLAILNSVQQNGVEAFQLQILCDSIEHRVAAGQIPDRDNNGLPDVSAEDLPDFTEVFALYYERRLSLLAEGHRRPARRVIEDGLIRYDPLTDVGSRLSVDGQALLKDFEPLGLTIDLLRKLEDTFLVRREPNTLGGHNYELSHDTLLAPVVRAKKQRLVEDANHRRLEELALEAGRIAREKAEAQRRQRRALFTSFIAGMLVLAAAIATGYAIIKTKQAKQAAKLAVDALLDAARHDIIQMRYDDAFLKLEKAEGTGSDKDSVAFELMEIAFFRYYSGRAQESLEPLLMAAKLLGKSDVLGKNNFQKIMAALEKDRDSLLIIRYFPEMRRIKGGVFTMGSFDEDDNYFESAKPPHQVTVSDFKLAKTETTVWQYNLYLAVQGKDINDPKIIESPSWGWEGNNPITNVSWEDAIGYSNWLANHWIPDYTVMVAANYNRFEVNWNAGGYRLPTEAEWEYAAQYSPPTNSVLDGGGDSFDAFAWYSANSRSRTRAVAAKKANGARVFDMSGNVWEWCFDRFSAYPANPVINPRGPNVGMDRVVRGGCWDSTPRACRIANRVYNFQGKRNVLTGFRVAMSL